MCDNPSAFDVNRFGVFSIYEYENATLLTIVL